MGIGQTSPGTLLELNGSAPYLTLKNDTHEDTEGGRESKIIFEGEQSGGEINALAQIQASHDGTSDDEKGDLIFYTNDGSDGASPTQRMKIDSSGGVGIGGEPQSGYKLYVLGKIHAGGNIKTGGNYISSDGNNSGIYIDAGNVVGINTSSPYTGSLLHVNGLTRVTSSGYNTDIGGTSIGFSGTGSVSAASGSLELQCSNKLVINSTQLTCHGNFVPNATGRDLGTATHYWDDFHYHNAVQHGTLCEVEDKEAIQCIRSLKPHKSKKGLSGKRKIDFKCFPKWMYYPEKIKKDRNGKIIEHAKEGVSDSGVTSILLSVCKQLILRVERLEKKIAKNKE